MELLLIIAVYSLLGFGFPIAIGVFYYPNKWAWNKGIKLTKLSDTVILVLAVTVFFSYEHIILEWLKMLIEH